MFYDAIPERLRDDPSAFDACEGDAFDKLFLEDCVDDDQRNDRSNKSDQNSLYYERCSYKKVCGTNILHDIDLIFSHRNTHSYCVADKEYRNQGIGKIVEGARNV